MASNSHYLYEHIRGLARHIDAERQQVEDELRELVVEEPIIGILVRDQVSREWDTMSGWTAFWVVIFAVKICELMGLLTDSRAKYPKLVKFFQHYIARAVLVVSLRLPEATTILSNLLNGKPLAPEDRAALEASYQDLLADSQALARATDNNAGPLASTSSQ